MMTARDTVAPEMMTACSIRKKRNVVKSVAKRQPADAALKIASPTRMTRRRPKRSEIGPTISCRTAATAAYAAIASVTRA